MALRSVTKHNLVDSKKCNLNKYRVYIIVIRYKQIKHIKQTIIYPKLKELMLQTDTIIEICDKDIYVCDSIIIEVVYGCADLKIIN